MAQLDGGGGGGEICRKWVVNDCSPFYTKKHNEVVEQKLTTRVHLSQYCLSFSVIPALIRLLLRLLSIMFIIRLTLHLRITSEGLVPS
jgi:hypothetical protein